MQSYKVERVVGEGSFGKALLCSRKLDAKKCIIKQISLGKMSRKEAQQTEQEAKLLERFNHPNIVAFWESFQETSQGKVKLCIVMEFADGGDLSNLIQSRKNRLMPETQVLNITVQIALALKHVIHTDIRSFIFVRFTIERFSIEISSHKIYFSLPEESSNLVTLELQKFYEILESWLQHKLELLTLCRLKFWQESDTIIRPISGAWVVLCLN